MWKKDLSHQQFAPSNLNCFLLLWLSDYVLVQSGLQIVNYAYRGQSQYFTVYHIQEVCILKCVATQGLEQKERAMKHHRITVFQLHPMCASVKNV